MAKYDKDTKFYWLQLKEDFFEDDAIEWLEEQKPNGRDYAYFYLKLCLKSLKSNGVLVRKVGKILIPYDNQKLAELTKMDFDTVTVAMELLKKIGLIQILENGEIYINQLENLIGSKSVGAFKKQQQRTLRGQKEDNCPPKIEIELEKEKEKEKEVEIELEEDSNIVTKMLPNVNNDVSKIDKLMIECLNTTNINNIMECTEYLNQIPIEVIEYALRKTARISQPNWKYAMSILDSYVSKKIDTIEKAKADDLNFKTNNKSKEETIEEANARKLKALEEMMKK